MKKTALTVLLLTATLPFQGCTPSSYGSQEALTAALVGTGVGSGVGWLIGNEIGNKRKNIAINGAIGGGLGLLAGAIINERNLQIAKKREVVMREARLIGKTQRELDKMREGIYDSSSWGGNEVKPWDERYTGEDSTLPFQGNTGYKHPSP